MLAPVRLGSGPFQSVTCPEEVADAFWRLKTLDLPLLMQSCVGGIPQPCAEGLALSPCLVHEQFAVGVRDNELYSSHLAVPPVRGCVCTLHILGSQVNGWSYDYAWNLWTPAFAGVTVVANGRIAPADDLQTGADLLISLVRATSWVPLYNGPHRSRCLRWRIVCLTVQWLSTV